MRGRRTPDDTASSSAGAATDLSTFHYGRDIINRIEQAEEVRIAARFGIDVDGLPRGVLVGTVAIVGCLPLKQDDSQAACFEIADVDGFYGWLLARPQRTEELVKPTRQPQPMFFNPF